MIFAGLSFFSSTLCMAVSYETTIGMGSAVVEKADNLWGGGHRRIKGVYSKPEPHNVLRVYPLFDIRAIIDEKKTEGSSEKINKSEIYFSTTVDPAYLSTGAKFSFGKSSLDIHGLYAFYASNWQNPYVLYRRSTTTMNYGGKITYTNIMDTGLSLSYLYTTTDVDKDRIGDLYRDLRQDGQTHALCLAYQYNITNTINIIPEITYEKGAFDGESNSYDSFTWAVKVNTKAGPALLSTRIFGQTALFERTHPIFDKTRKETTYGGQFTAIFKEPFGWKKYSLSAGVAGSKSNANITFFDKYSVGVFTGMSYTF